MYAISDILLLAERYAGARRIATSTLARIAAGSSTWFDRCASGRVTIRSAVAVVQWLSDHWPDGLEWPAEIARPTPAPNSLDAPPRSPPSPAGNPLIAVDAANPRMRDSERRNDRNFARRPGSILRPG